MSIEDIKLELVALQKLDTQNAINYGAKSKSDWFKQIITTEDNDIIAESIIDLSTRANATKNCQRISKTNTEKK